MESSTNMKLISYLIFNIANLGIAVFLLTYTTTYSVSSPLGTYTQTTGQPYSPSSWQTTNGWIAWVGWAIAWFVGNGLISEVKTPESLLAKTRKRGESLESTKFLAVVCPSCKSQVPSMMKFCPDCGTGLQKP